MMQGTNIVLCGISILLLLIWCGHYYWSRRRLYHFARQRPGPLSLPLIGSAFYLVGRSKHVFDKMFRFIAIFQSPAPLWLGPHLFFVIWNPENLKIVLNSQHCLDKSVFYKFVENAIGKGLISHQSQKWKRHRKIIAPIFNKKILDRFVKVFHEKSSILSQRLEEEVGKRNVDVFDIFSCFAFDVLFETGVGVTTNVQTIDSNQADWFNIAKDVTFIRMNNILYHFDCIFKLTSHYKKLTEAVDNIQAMIADVVRKQIQLFRNDLPEESRPCTFLQKLIEVSKSDVNFTQTDLEEEIVTFLIGGNDTMATTLSYVLMMLGMHPQIQEEVYEEIKSSIGLSQKILEDDLIHFEYLDRVIRETLRLFPPAPCVSRQVTEDIQLENCIVPAGCEIVIAVIAVHRDPKVWPNPLNFDPNRFLPDVSKHPYSWIPFLNGPRNCVASKFAMMTMKVAIAVLVSKYTFKTEYKSVQDVKFEANLLLKPIDGYKVTLELRK